MFDNGRQKPFLKVPQRFFFGAKGLSVKLINESQG